jgi:hypothetical protein
VAKDDKLRSIPVRLLFNESGLDFPRRSMNQHSKRLADVRCCAPDPLRSPRAMMRPDARVEKVYLYSKPVDFRTSIDGLAALLELDIKVAMFDPMLFVFSTKPATA